MRSTNCPLVIKLKDGHSRQQKPLVGDGARGHDGLAIGSVLAQPRAASPEAAIRPASLPKTSATRRSASERAEAASGL